MAAKAGKWHGEKPLRMGAGPDGLVYNSPGRRTGLLAARAIPAAARRPAPRRAKKPCNRQPGDQQPKFFCIPTRHQRTFDFQAWAPDSARLFIFASNVSDQVPLPDTLLQHHRRRQAQTLARQWLRESPAAQSVFETVLIRTIQQCANCDPNKSMAERYPIDTLLKDALAQQGISLPFAAGLRNRKTNQWNKLYLTSHADTLQLAASSLSVPLLGEQEELIVYFPNQQHWILNRLWLQLVASGLLVVIIFGSFYYAWRIISRQKSYQR